MMFLFHKFLVFCVFIAYFVFDICCDLQIVQYSKTKEISPTHFNHISLSMASPTLFAKNPLKIIEGNTIVTKRRRKKRRRRKKTQTVSQSTTAIPALETKVTDDLLTSTPPTTKRPRRRRIKIRKKLGKRPAIKSNNTALTKTEANCKNNSSFKSPTFVLETKSLVLPVIPTPKFSLIEKNKSDNMKKTTKNTRCKKNNGGCAHVCLFKGTKKCQCFKGFRLAGDKKNCVDINECSTNINSCQGNCTNTIGSYRCHCPRGLRLGIDSKSCEDVNECRLRNGHGPCQDTCQNTYGGYKCNCDGLKGTRLGNNLHSCVDVDECSKENGGCSHICINTFGKSFCSCPEGSELSLDFKTCLSSDSSSYNY